MKPKLRFKEFTDEWEEKKLGEIANVIMGQSPNSDSYNKNNKGLPLIQGNADIKNGKTIRRIFTTCPTKVCDKNTLIMTVRAPVGELGIATDKVCIGRGICAIISPLQIYIYHYLKAKKEKWTIYSQGSTFEAVNSKDIKDFKIQLPSFQEQEKISKFFSLLDQQIKNQERKIELLEKEKKGYIQKLFKQELRFKDEQGNDYPDWEEKKLGDIAQFFSGGTPKSTNKKYYMGDIPFIRSGEINETETELFINELALKNSSAKIVKKGDILYAMYGATAGNVSISKINGAINQAILCIRTSENNFYIQQYLMKNKEIYLNIYLQGGQGNLSANIIKNFKIQLPSLLEQNKIANFLSLLDQRIKKEQEKLKLMKDKKIGLMKQMFV